MIYFSQARDLAIKFHDKQPRRGIDGAYIIHAIKVAVKVRSFLQCSYNHIAVIAAVLHDVIEDTDATTEKLISLGAQDDIMIILNILTRKEGESSAEHFTRVCTSGNYNAWVIKMCDLEHNSIWTTLDKNWLARHDPSTTWQQEQQKYLTRLEVIRGLINQSDSLEKSKLTII